jgi:septum formation protein
MTLVLASASPRRRELLTQAGYIFTVHPAHIPEDPLPNEDPIAYVVRLARQKAETVFAELTRSRIKSEQSNPPEVAAPQAPSAPPQVVLGADTTVVIDSDAVFPAISAVPASEQRASAAPQVLAKPTDAADAARMLRLLSGRTHRVITGVAVVTAQHTEVAAEVTGVRFLTLSEEEIAAYIATGEPMDKAGAYAIQGRAARWIPRIVGDYFNVVGLPLALVSTMLEAVRSTHSG